MGIIRSFSLCFICLLFALSGIGQNNITIAEYYVDADPGYGNGVPITIASPATNLSSLSFTVDLSSLSIGAHLVGVRSKDANGAWSLDNKFIFAKISVITSVPNIYATEYYIDNDPGYGNGIPASITNSTDGTGSFIADLTSLSLGSHVIGVRSRDANGAWSLDNKFTFAKISVTASAPNISRTEYYIDNDPGYGNGITASITNSTDGSGSFIADLTSLSLGTHLVVVRSKDANGAWGLDNKFTLAKISVTASATNIARTEYYIDTDPGYGNGITASITNSTDGSGSFIADFTSLSLGAHTIGVRSRDANGAWSLDNKFTFAKISVDLSDGTVPNLSRTEYYIDSDPGYGNGIEVSITGTTQGTGSFIADLTSLSTGMHTVGVRTKDANGRWSLDNKFIFAKLPITASIPNITGAEYYINTDPGYGNGTPVSIAASTPATFSFIADLTGLPYGTHNVVVRTKDANGSWSLDNNYSFIAPPGPVSCINVISPANGAAFVEPGGLMNWTPAIPGHDKYYVYIGTDSLNLDRIDSVTTTHYTFSLSVNTKYFWKIIPYSIYDTASECPIWSFTTRDHPPPCAGLISPADGDTSVPSNTHLNWISGGGSPNGYYVKIGMDTANLSLYSTTSTSFQTSLNYDTIYYWQIVPYNGNGSAISCPIRSFRTITCIPATITASGPTILCPGQSVTLSTVDSISYTWNNGLTAQSITVSTPAEYYVSANLANGCIFNSNTITVSSDIRPSINSGNINSICDGDSLTLSYAPVASLSWSTGATTTSIIVHPSVTTTYAVQGITSTNCIYNDSIRVVINPSVPPDLVTNMLPANGSTELDIPLNLSWLPGSNTTKYDLYVWPDTIAQPAAPLVANLAVINFTLNSPGVVPGVSYKWQVVAKNGNCFNTPGPIQTFATKNLPDLIVDSINVPSIVSSGNQISISWKVKNSGIGNTGSTPWLDHIWLSADTSLQDELPESDHYLGGVPNLSALLAGESYLNTATFTVPDGIGGIHHVIIKTNQLGTQSPVSSVIESIKTNNSIVSDSLQVNLTLSPDLRVTSIVTPLNVFSGLKVNLNWTVTNMGNDIINAGSNWVDRVYISFSPFFNLNTAILLGNFPHTGILLQDSSYISSDSITIPKYIFGLYYIYVVTDFYNQIYEVPFDNNNISHEVITIYLNPPPDLAVQSFTTPVTGSSGTPVSLSWTVQNAGANPTDNSWTDKIYISLSGTFNLSNAVEIGTADSPGILNVGDSYNHQLNVNIPNNYNGDYYLYIYTDANNSLFEYTSEQNNILRSDTTIQITSADLIVDTVFLPATANSGQNISVNWRVNNQGNGDIFNATRIDSIYLSAQPTFNFNTAIALGRSLFSESIAHGSSVTKQASVTVPNGISGNYYLFVLTDAGNSIFENGNETNNRTRSVNPVNITLSQSADLIVQSIQVPDSVAAGFMMPLSFTIMNTGTASAIGTTWNDYVYISPYPVWDWQNSLFLGSFTRTQSLVSNSTYTISDSVKVGVSLTGKLIVNGHLLDSSYAYIYIFTDADSQVYEYNAENNNILASDSAFIIPPRIDLEVTAVHSSDSAFSGQPANIYWTVRNNGISTDYKGSHVPSFWSDVVYLSQDTVWDASDILVSGWVYSNLPKDSSYSDNRNFIVPNGLSGYYYLLLISDHNNDLPEDVKRGNNYKLIRDDSTGALKQFHIILSAPPDLTVTQVTTPATGTAGQQIIAKWTGKNNGAGITGASAWTDGIYLSANFAIDGNDILLGTRTHAGNLSPGQLYNDSLELILPGNLSGNYILIIVTDILNNVYEHQNENNNSKYSFISIVIPPSSDLIVTSVQLPDSAIAGQAVSISYIIKNIGPNPAMGLMGDGVYLSRDSVWDISDPLIGTVTGNINLAPNGQATRNITAPVTGTGLGYYKVIVKTDRLNNIIETNDANNNKASIDSIRIDVNQLPLNVLTPDTLNNNTYLYYRIEIPDSLSGETLLITLKGDSLHASNELYVKFGSVPGRALYDFNHGILSGGNQEVLIPSLQAGTYYLACYGNNTSSNDQAITLKAVILPFAIRTVNSNKGGNTGSVTIEITGSKFEPNMQIRLDNGGGTTVTASGVYYINAAKLFVSFDLRNKPLGFYHVLAKKTDSSQAILANGFEIVTGSGGGFYVSGTNSTADPGCDPNAANGVNSLITVSLQYPAASRVNRVNAITIFYGNSGNVDIPVPTRFVFSKDGAPLSLTVNGLSQNLQDLYLEFKEINGPPNILRPGATGAITIYTKAVAPMNFLLSD